MKPDSQTDIRRLSSRRERPAPRPPGVPTRWTRVAVRLGAIWAAAGFWFVVLAQPVSSANQPYLVALRLFEDGVYELASKEFAAFVRDHPEAPEVPQAILYQAQALFRQGAPADAVRLLRERLSQAGPLAGEYRFWTAESLYKMADYADAAREYADLLQQHPDSPRGLEASVGQAYCLFRSGDLRQTVALLDDPNGAFGRSARGQPASDWTARGLLLLAEAHLGLGDYEGSLAALQRMDESTLAPERAWHRQYLVARARLGKEELAPALATVTNLLTQVRPSTNRIAIELKEDALGLSAQILERMNQPEAAIQAYEQNLTPTTSAGRRLEAVQQIVRLTLAQNRTEDAVARLEEFVRQYPEDPTIDLIRLTLGELGLRLYYELAPEGRLGATNTLTQARALLSRVATNANPELMARARLDRGWTLWEEGLLLGLMPRVEEAIPDFQAAAERLPVSEPQAIARFKLADCQFVLTHYPAAISNYWIVSTNYTRVPSVQEGLAPYALYQIVRAATADGNLAAAELAIRQILRDYPENYYGERSLLWYGQALNRQGSPAEARALFAEFIKRFPGSELIAEVELALARTHTRERNWPAAVAEYDRWITNHLGHPRLSKADFERAWALYLDGREPEAYARFTNFVARFPNDPLTPWGEHWIAGHYFREERFDQAELAYQRIFQNTNRPVTELHYHARLMAGRSAFFRQGYADARGYLTNLLNDSQCPAHLLPELYFDLGLAMLSDRTGLTTNALSRFSDAVAVFVRIPQDYPESAQAPLAWGQLGNCYLQLARADAKNYDRAIEAYRNVSTSLVAGVAARSQAEVGLGIAFERKADLAPPAEKPALREQALEHYLRVVEGGLLRPGEVADPFWIKEAGLAATRLVEEQQRWEVARRLYRRLIDLAPALRPIWEARIQRLPRIEATPAAAGP